MTWLIVAISVGVMLALAAVMAVVLIRAHGKWAVTEYPFVAEVEAALAGLDCGQCGHPTCNEYARGVVNDREPVDRCRPGGRSSAEAVAALMGVEAPAGLAHYAVVHCGAVDADRLGQAAYQGERSCAAADLVAGIQACPYGCLGLGDCEAVCPFNAIHIIDQLAVVDYDKCTACGACSQTCPRAIITILPFKAEPLLTVACNNRDPGAAVRSACEVGCIACGLCAKASDLFALKKNLSRLDYDAYDPATHREQLQIAADKCPTGCLPFRGRPASN